jgi:glycosyltransferase involved in cell wall biosynthesis
MILGVIPSLGESIEILTRVGVAPRFINAYLGRYSREFEKTYYFTNSNEEPGFPPRVFAVPKKTPVHYTLYALLLPFIQRERVKECDCFRVMQLIGAVPAVIIKLIYRKPYVATYGFKYTEYAKKDYSFWVASATALIEYFGLRLADAIIVTTQELKKYVGKSISEQKIHLIPNGVDTKLFRPSSQRENIKKKDVILFIGRLSKEKNLFSLIEGVSLLPSKVPLLFIGDGSLKEELIKFAKEKSVNLQIETRVANDELPRYINEAEVFILPSLTEGHPKVLLEAMSCGIPCIGTNVPGIRDLIQDGVTGILCSDTTSESVARGIERLMREKNLAETIGVNARKFIQEHYELNRLLDQEINLLKSVAGKYRVK